jgi:hypothetical protein
MSEIGYRQQRNTKSSTTSAATKLKFDPAHSSQIIALTGYYYHLMLFVQTCASTVGREMEMLLDVLVELTREPDAKAHECVRLAVKTHLKRTQSFRPVDQPRTPSSLASPLFHRTTNVRLECSNKI